MKAVAYLRCSTLGQDLSPDVQRAAILAFCARSGLTVAEWFEDIGVSGGAELDDCPGLEAALRALKPGMVLVVAKMDRLARDVFKHALLERLVAASKCKIVSADGTGNGDGPEAAMLRAIVSAFAAYERALIRMRTKAALGVLRAKGLRTTRHAPLGHAWADGRLVPAPGEQAMIAEARELAPGRSASQVAALLNAKGYRNRLGQPVSKGTVLRMLRAALARTA